MLLFSLTERERERDFQSHAFSAFLVSNSNCDETPVIPPAVNIRIEDVPSIRRGRRRKASPRINRFHPTMHRIETRLGCPRSE